MAPFFRVALLALPLLLLPLPGRAGEAAGPVPAPGPRAVCPVCGMFVAKYPEWVATLVFENGEAHHFDGSKDLFKFLFKLSKYAPGHTGNEISRIAVTEYYDLKKINARTAFFVIDSDVRGPMGRELVPLASRADAEEFMADHKGRGILTFSEVTPDMIHNLDRDGL